MKARIVSAVAVLALAATCLTACRTHVGTAATVQGHRISENTVNDYVEPSGPTAATSSTATAAPKPIALQYLVLREVFRRTLTANKAKTGGVPSAATLATYHDKAVQLLLQSPVTGAKFDAAIKTEIAKSGIKKSLLPVYLEVQELEYVLVEKLKLSSPTDVANTVAKAGISVRINPRYGSWEASQLAVSTAGGQPSYLKLQSTAAAAPAGS